MFGFSQSWNWQDIGNSTGIDDNSLSRQFLFFIASCDFDDFIGKEMSFRIDDVNTSATDCCVVLPVETAGYSVLFSHDLVESQAFFSCDKQGLGWDAGDIDTGSPVHSLASLNQSNFFSLGRHFGCQCFTGLTKADDN